MKKYEDKVRIGEFYISSDPIVGQLRLNAEDSVLELHSKEFFHTHFINGECIKGVLNDNQRVSLIDCISNGSGRGGGGNEEYHFSTIFPHYVVFGDEHIDSADEKILSLRAVLEDATDLFYDFDVFSKVLDKEYDARSVIEQVEKNREREIEIGDYPMLFYYSGKREIFKASTVFGDISASHSPSYSMPSPDGIQVKNNIPVCIKFKSPVSFKTAINDFWVLLGFIDFMAGRPQRLQQFSIEVTTEKDHPLYLDVYWCLPPNRNTIDRNSRKPHPMDVLINGAIQAKEFGEVLTAWLDRQKEWHDSRERFIQSFRQQNNYTIDRLVGAANMFDILPSTAVGEAGCVLQVIQKICDESKKLWKTCPDGPEKNSILGALGRIGKHSLKTKIKNRAKLITDKLPQKFPELEAVIDEAVNCRNFYVHGKHQGNLPPESRSEFGPFFVDTLEFIFGASDLIEAGWDVNRWVKQGSCLTHPYGGYLHGYSQRIQNFKKAVAKSA